MSFFSLTSVQLVLILLATMLGATALGWLGGRWLRDHADALREPLGVLQGALLGLVALILAFGMTMAVGRYDNRRTAVVDEANAIGTTFLRAQTLHEPFRQRSLEILPRYTDTVIRFSETIPGTRTYSQSVAQAEELQRQLWSIAGDALAGAPTESAPRLYVETLNDTIDMETVRIAALSNRIPSTVLAIEVIGAAIALGLLAVYLAVLSRGMVSVVIAAVFVAVLLFVTFDMDRPTRGPIQVPDTALVALRASMELPPAAAGHGGR